jgi:hypothetical protein
MLLISLLSCSDDDDDPNIVPGAVRYTVTITANWTSITHPTDYPSGAHFSPVIGMVHKSGASFFNENELASEGIEVMAETGGTSSLDAEINQIVNSGNALSLIKAGGLATGTSTIVFEIGVENEFNLVTLVSMIAPSPDWFIAVKDINLWENNAFVETKTVNTVVYDSGTDSGLSFTSANEDTNPAENITKIITSPLGDGNDVTPSLVTIKFDKL